MIVLDLSILNQKGTPMFNSDIFANRPAAGVVGRIFISTDTYAIYRDTGSAWDQIGGSGSGITGSGTAGTLPIWTSSSVLSDSIVSQSGSSLSITSTGTSDSELNIDSIASNFSRINFKNNGNIRTRIYYREDLNQLSLGTYNSGGSIEFEVDNNVTAAIIDSSKNATFYGYVAATPTLTAANNASSLASYGINTLSYAAGFSSNNIGALYGGMAGFNLQTFAGSATFAQANVASGGASVNSIDFSSAGSTITMTQSSGIRAMTGQQNLFQYQGTNSGTITHAAISQNTGFYRPSGASGTLTITNAYSHLINALDDYGAGFSFTNRWGIYQAGASDKNYFAANTLIGLTSIDASKPLLQVAGTIMSSGDTLIAAPTIASVVLDYHSPSNAGRLMSGSAGSWNKHITIVPYGGNLLIGSTSNPGQKLYLNGSLRIDGQTSGSSGGFSGQHLIINCDGTNYKIKLENV